MRMAVLILLLASCPEVAPEPSPEATPTPVPRGPGCAAADFDATDWVSADEAAIEAPVPDVTLQTLSGETTLSALWGDCSVFTLVPWIVNFDGDSVAELVEASEPNNTYLFYSWSTARQELMEAIQGRIQAELDSRGEAYAAEWGPRFRFIVDDPWTVPFLAATDGIGTDFFLIDSHQRLRDAGSFRAFNGDFVPQLQMVRYAARWFNYERRTEERLAAQAADPDVLTVPWITEGWHQTDAGRFAVQLPSAAEMARFDRMEIVVKETCEPGSRFPIHAGVCPAWDVGHKVTLCDDFEGCLSSEKQQLYRHVTGYHSGVWLYEDVSHGLPWFQKGGERWLRTDRNNFFGTIDFVFFDDGDASAEDDVAAAHHLLDMGRAQFDAAHNDSFPTYSFTPPEGTVRVVMDARVQGGGNQQGNGCAEFCSHHHAIDVNGTGWEHTFVMNQGSFDCAERAHEGVTAGQFGTWFIDRGSWCPGGPVERWRQDITDAVDLAGPNTLTWTGSFEGDTWPPGGGTTATVWLVFFGGEGDAEINRLPVEDCPNPPSMTIRDFPRGHPDFEPIRTAWQALEDGDPAKEAARGVLTGVVADALVETADGWKPQLVWEEDVLPYTTAESFADWWRDSAESQVVSAAPDSFRRTRQDTFGFFRSNADSNAEFPLVAAESGFGAEGVEHGHEGGTPVNSSFTVEIAGSFVHRAGVRLRLASRSDLWVFVDHELVHESAGMVGKGLPKDILSLDSLGLTEGESYDLQVFAVGGRGAESNPQLWLEHPACL